MNSKLRIWRSSRLLAYDGYKAGRSVRMYYLGVVRYICGFVLLAMSTFSPGVFADPTKSEICLRLIHQWKVRPGVMTQSQLAALRNCPDSPTYLTPKDLKSDVGGGIFASPHPRDRSLSERVRDSETSFRESWERMTYGRKKRLPPTSMPALQAGAKVDSASLFACVQEKLTKLGYRVGSNDGIWGERSRDALAAFKRKLQLPNPADLLTEDLPHFDCETYRCFADVPNFLGTNPLQRHPKPFGNGFRTVGRGLYEVERFHRHFFLQDIYRTYLRIRVDKDVGWLMLWPIQFDLLGDGCEFYEH